MGGCLTLTDNGRGTLSIVSWLGRSAFVCEWSVVSLWYEDEKANKRECERENKERMQTENNKKATIAYEDEMQKRGKTRRKNKKSR